jgi:hypothetical protein
MLAGAYRLSKRQIQQMVGDLFSLSISTGMISKLESQSAAALEAPYNELAMSVHEAEVVNEEGSRCGCAKTGATCFEILKVEEGLWTFARLQDVEATNNVAERAMRHAVIWRKISGGTDSPNGSRFVERMFTVDATCRQQGRNVLDYLTACFEATRHGQPIPSYLPPKQKKSQSSLIPPTPPC